MNEHHKLMKDDLGSYIREYERLRNSVRRSNGFNSEVRLDNLSKVYRGNDFLNQTSISTIN